MNQITLATKSNNDLKLLLSLAKRLDIRVLSVASSEKDNNTSTAIVDEQIDIEEMLVLLENSNAFDFLKAEAEDIYSDEDLKIVY